MGWLYMRDFLTLAVKGTENKRYLFECKDSSSPTGKSLSIRAEATHSGIVNGNARFYRPDRMQDSVHTWTPKGKPARPVLVNHDREGECIGRVHKARYVDLSYLYTQDVPGVKGLCFYDSGPKKLNLFNSVDWVMRNLHGKPDYKGLGYIELGLNIADPAAIAKVQDGRYLTVSVGFGTDAAICSVCHTDWASEEDRCEHELGHLYDGKPCFLISGNFTYKECSMVNIPADPWGAITGKDSLQQVSDSVANRVFFMGLSQAEQKKRFMIDGKLSLDYTDSISFLGSDIQLVGKDIDERTDEADMDLKAIQDEIRSKDLTKNRALEIKTELDTAEDKVSVKRLLSSLNAKIRANKWVEPAGPSKDAVAAKIADLDAVLAALPEEARDGYRRELQDQAEVFGLELPETHIEAPVADAASAAETTPETVSAPARLQFVTDLVKTEVTDANADTKIDGKAAVSSLEALHEFYEGVPDEDKCLFRSAVSAMLEHWYSGSNLQYYKTRLMGKASDAVVAKDELDELHVAVEQYEQDVKRLESDKEALLTTNRQAVKDQKSLLARVLVTGNMVLAKPGFTGLSADQVQQEITERSGRKLNSLQDSLTDLLKELPGADIKPAASESKPPEESVRQVSDTAKVESDAGPEVKPGAEEPVTDSGERQLQTAIKLVGPKEARRMAAKARFQANSKSRSEQK